MVSEKLLRVEQALEEAFHPVTAHQGQQATFTHAWLIPA